MRKAFITTSTITLIVLLILALSYAVFILPKKPSNNRDWSLDQKILPEITFTDGDHVSIRNIRNFDYTSTSTYTPQYYERTLDLRELRTLDFILEPFKDPGAAHTLLSFGFSDGSYLAVSVEIRKEVEETFSPLSGVLREYELMYVIADERDVIKLRSNYRKDTVYLYPVDATPDAIRTLFTDMLLRAQTLSTHPEFYNTLTSNCIINIVKHVNKLALRDIPWNHRLIFPAHADEYAQKLGLIAEGMTIEAAREKYRINERALQYADDPEFSKRIRE